MMRQDERLIELLRMLRSGPDAPSDYYPDAKRAVELGLISGLDTIKSSILGRDVVVMVAGVLTSAGEAYLFEHDRK